MSRFYALELFAPNTQNVGIGVTLGAPESPTTIPPIPSKKITYANTPSKVWTSHPNGIYDPKAQNIEFDVLILDQAMGNSPSFLVTVEGVSFDDIRQHQNFRNYGIRLYAGMLPGLPLANNQPTPGLVAQGYVQQGIGNWVGEDMTLTFVCYWSPFTASNPGPIVFQWNTGQSLQAALQSCLATAYPGYPVTIQISQNLATTHPVTHAASTLGDLAFWLKKYTKGEVSATYPGISIYHQQDGSILATDRTAKPTATKLLFTDLIGQPAWAGGETEAYALDVVTALRSDISAGNALEMPQVDLNAPGLVFEMPSFNNASVDYNLSFNGKFTVASARYVGNFRSSNAAEWVTVYRCYADQTA